MLKLIIFAIAISLYLIVYVFRIDVLADTDTEMIAKQDVKSWVERIENSVTAKEKICVLGTTFVFSNVKMTDGKLVLFYNFDSEDTYCYRILHESKSPSSSRKSK